MEQHNNEDEEEKEIQDTNGNSEIEVENDSANGVCCSVAATRLVDSRLQ
jgi:hypothetical protein